jgi:glutathione S-transferase
MDEFVVWGVPGSPYVRAALVGLEEKGVRWRLAPLGLRDVKSPAHLDRHPFGRMPVLDHGDFRLYEVQAILRYLDRIFPAPPFTPADPKAEARMNQIAGIADWYFMPQVASALAFQRVVAPRFGLPVDEAKIAAALPAATVCVGEVARLLGEQSYMAGESLSLADVMLAPQVTFLTEFAEGRTLLAPHPHLADWIGRMEARPSMQATTWDRMAQAAAAA